MAIVFECPVCEFQGKVADVPEGEKITCKACGHQFSRPTNGSPTTADSGANVTARSATTATPAKARPAAVTAAAGSWVVIRCPDCQTYGKVPASARSRSIKCPKCSKSFTVPAEAAATPPPSAVKLASGPTPGPVDAGPPIENAARTPEPAPVKPAASVALTKTANDAETLIDDKDIGLAPVEGEAKTAAAKPEEPVEAKTPKDGKSRTEPSTPAKDEVIEVVDESAILIEAACPRCKFKGNIPAKLAGKRVKCPRCSNSFEVADPAATKNGSAARKLPGSRPGTPAKTGDDNPLAAMATDAPAGTEDNPFSFVDAALPAPGLRDTGTSSPAVTTGSRRIDRQAGRDAVPMLWKWTGVVTAAAAVLVGGAFAIRSVSRSIAKPKPVAVTSSPGESTSEGPGADAKANPTEPPPGDTKVPPDPAGGPTVRPTEPPAPVDPKDITWVNASTEAAKLDGVRIRVSATWLDVVKGQAGATKNKYLLVQLEIENQSTNKEITYHGWGLPDVVPGRSIPAAVTDNAGKAYKVPSRDELKIKPGGQVEHDFIKAGQTLDDLLVFEAVPVEKVEYLRLTLPAVNLGGKGVLGLQIPASMLVGRKTDPLVKLPTDDPKPVVEKDVLAKVNNLIAQMRKGGRGERVNAIRSLGDMGAQAGPAVPELAMTLLKDKDEQVRAASAETLGRMGPAAKGAINALISALRDEFYKVQANSAEALATFGPDAREAVPKLKKLLASKESEVAQKAALALSKIDVRGRPLPPKKK